MSGWLQVLVAVLALTGTAFTTWLTVRQTGKRDRSDTTQKLIDQLQEERDAADTRHKQEIEALEGRYMRELLEIRSEFIDLRERVDGMEDRELAFSDYVAQLRHHIDQRLGPPPPEWPAALMRRRRD